MAHSAARPGARRRLPATAFATAFARAASGFALLDDELRVLEANHALHSLLGAPICVGATLDEHAREPGELQDALSALRSHGSVHFDLQLAPGSPTRWVHVVASRYDSCAYLGFCLYGTSETGAKRTAGNVDDDEMTFGIVVEGTVPDCRYWSISLLSRFMESGDWVHHPVALTGRDIGGSAGQRFRVVVAHHDPGAGTWLATTGLTSANIAVRALKASDVLDLQFSRVPLTSLERP